MPALKLILDDLSAAHVDERACTQRDQDHSQQLVRARHEEAGSNADGGSQCEDRQTNSVKQEGVTRLAQG